MGKSFVRIVINLTADLRFKIKNYPWGRLVNKITLCYSEATGKYVLKRVLIMKKRFLSAILILAMTASMIVGCGGKEDAAAAPDIIEESAETAERDSVIVAMGHGSEPEAGFDPAYGWGAGEHVHEPLIQSTLTVTTTDLEIAYDLATDVRVSEDGMVWTVVIRDDVKFTDGESLTASDVAFT